MPAAVRRPPPLWSKLAAASGLIALGDAMAFRHMPANPGLFCLAWIVSVLLLSPATRRDRRALLAAATAIALALLQLESPTLLGWTLFCVALAVTVLSARAGPDEDVGRWVQRLLHLAVVGLAGPFIDLLGLGPRRRRKAVAQRRNPISLLALPLLGGLVFAALFAAANPVFARLLGVVQMPDMVRLAFWLLILILVWSGLRPRFQRHPLVAAFKARGRDPVGVSTASVTLSLVVFNLLFAVQNGLDLAFLWSGAPLPEGVTLADYAHRGAYPLIATALLAGLFVLVALRPGSETSATPLVRRLVMLWVAQNLVLVASSILRTVDYIEVYSLTRFRIAALIWMVLVGLGLVLICWRMLRGKSAGWLINANALAAGLVLLGVSVIDLGEVAATWNVTHAREMGGRGTALDLAYLRGLGDSAALPLARLERRMRTPDALRRQAGEARLAIARDLTRRQGDWRSWSWRGDRRLREMQTLLGHPAAQPDPPSLAAPATAQNIPPPPSPSPLTSPSQSQ